MDAANYGCYCSQLRRSDNPIVNVVIIFIAKGTSKNMMFSFTIPHHLLRNPRKFYLTKRKILKKFNNRPIIIKHKGIISLKTFFEVILIWFPPKIYN